MVVRLPGLCFHLAVKRCPRAALAVQAYSRAGNDKEELDGLHTLKTIALACVLL